MNDPGRLNSLPPEKYKEVFGADAVLKTRVTEWSSKYIVIVGFEMKLFDCNSGDSLWVLERTLSKSPNNGNLGLIGSLVNNAIHAASAPYEPIARENSETMMKTVPRGKYSEK